MGKPIKKTTENEDIKNQTGLKEMVT